MFAFLALILVFVALLPFSKTKATKYKNFLLDNFFWIGLFVFILGVALNMADLDYTTLYDELISFFAMMMLSSPFVLMRNVINKFKKNKKESKDNNISYDSINRAYQQEQIQLPRLAVDRKKIVEKFNDKFMLSLTDSEMSKIVNGSFQSPDWSKEIIAMTRDYNTISEWYNSETDWLRAYLKAFSVQNVSSDFAYQKQMCLSNYDELFSKINMESYLSIDDCIKAVNDRFMTHFDDVSFMIAYRFLEENGKKYILPKSGVVQMYSELEELESKYCVTKNGESVHN